MEFKNDNFSNTFLLYRSGNKFEIYQPHIMSIEKIKLLNNQVEIEENKAYSFLHVLFSKYFNEWNNKKAPASLLLNDIYKRIYKSNPELFYDLKDNTNETLKHILSRITNSISKHKISIDYSNMRYISIMILNCVHFVIKSKKISMLNFLKKENFNNLPYLFINFFNELENVKTLHISLFDDYEKLSSHFKSSINLISFTESKISNHVIERTNSNLIHNNLLSQDLIESHTPKEKEEKSLSEFGYLFYMFLSFIFPNHLKIKLNLNMEKYLEKYRVKNSKIDKIIKKYKHNFIILLLTTYFISKNNNIQKLTLIVNDSLKYEINHFMKIHDITDKKGFIFIDNLLRNMNCYYLNLEFNCLDNCLFEKFNFIIFKSLSIKSLHLTLFPKTNNIEYHLKKNLKRIDKKEDHLLIESQEENQNTPNIESEFNKINNHTETSRMRDSNLFNSMHSFLDDEFYNSGSNEVMTLLFDKFNENLKNLFLIVESKIKILRELKIVINPNINIVEKLDYNSALMSFIFNVLKIIENKFNEITSFEIISESIALNYNLLGLLSSKNHRKINLRKTKILNLTYNLKLDGYLNITKFIPESVVYLNLVSISSEIFILFVEKLKKRSKLYNSLEDLNISVVLTNKGVDKLINSTIDLFEIEKPSCLEVISFKMKYVLKNKDISRVITSISKSNDNIKRYHLEFGTTSQRETLNRIYNKFKTKILTTCFTIKTSYILKKVYEKSNVIKLITLFAYSYQKQIIIN